MSIKELKEREKAQRREYIVDAAEKLFFAKGYDNVSMNDIAAAVGMNKATLYLYFENKDSLFFAVALRGARLMNELFQNAMARGNTGIEKLTEIGQAYFDYHRQYADYYKLFGQLTRLDPGQSEEGREFMQLMQDQMMIMCRSIKAGAEDGTIRKDIDPMAMAIFLASSSEKVADMSAGMCEVLAHKGISYDQYVADAMRLLGSSIQPRGADPIKITAKQKQQR